MCFLIDMGAWPNVFFLKHKIQFRESEIEYRNYVCKFNDNIKFCFQQLRAISHYNYDYKSFREFYGARENKKSVTLVCRYYI